MTNARDKANIPVLNFSSKGIDDNADATAITISSAENVGIGTTSPTSTFRTSIKGDYSSIIGGIEFDSGGGDKFTVGHASATSPSGTLNVVGSGNLILKTTNTERFRIKSDGTVGIGTSTPNAELHISKSGNGNTTELILENTFTASGSTDETTQLQSRFGGYDASYIITGKEEDFTTSANRSSFMSFTTRKDGTLSEKLRIKADGNVGIGTTSPSEKLEVNGTIKATGFDGANAPAWSAKLSSAQSCANNASVLIICDTEELDTDSAYNTSTGIFTVPSGKGGKYMVGAVYRTNGSQASTRIATSLFVGSNVIRQTNFNQVASGEATGACHAVLNLSAGNEVSFKIFQNSGSTINAEASGKTYFYGYKIG